jgi:hypothetical protein
MTIKARDICKQANYSLELGEFEKQRSRKDYGLIIG